MNTSVDLKFFPEAPVEAENRVSGHLMFFKIFNKLFRISILPFAYKQCPHACIILSMFLMDSVLEDRLEDFCLWFTQTCILGFKMWVMDNHRGCVLVLFFRSC